MLACAVLTPAESKKLIAKAVLQLPEVQRALKNGTVVIHPSSTTTFIYEELMGFQPEDSWVFGVVSPKGLCRSCDAIKMLQNKDPNQTARKAWIFQKGILQDSVSLNDLFDQMDENDIFIKSGNAIDPEGRVATLTSNPKAGGTTGKVRKYAEKRHFKVILPTGLEKLIPTPVSEVCGLLNDALPDECTGLPCGIYPAEGRKIDERDALRILCDVKSVVGAAGGLGGAEGSIILYLIDEDAKVRMAFDLLKEIKGASLPNLELPEVL